MTLFPPATPATTPTYWSEMGRWMLGEREDRPEPEEFSDDQR